MTPRPDVSTTVKASRETVRRLRLVKERGRFRSMDELLTTLAQLAETRPQLVNAARSSNGGAPPV